MLPRPTPTFSHSRSPSTRRSLTKTWMPPLAQFRVSLALGLEAGGWGALVERSSGHHHHHHGGGSGTGGGGSSLIGHGSFASLAGLARRCGVCLATFPSAWLLERHALLQHAGQSNDDKPFTCEQCGQRYRYRSAYVKHREQNHRARLPADKLFTCDVCGMQFRYLKSFKKHRLNHALERLQRAPSETHNVSVLTSPVAERSDQVSSTGEPSQIETGSDSTTNPGDVEESRGIFSENARGEESVSETTSIQDNPGEAIEAIQMTDTLVNETTTTTTTATSGMMMMTATTTTTTTATTIARTMTSATTTMMTSGCRTNLAGLISPSMVGSDVGLHNIGTVNAATMDVVADPDESVLDDGEHVRKCRP
ncbi:zinc finger protein 853-like isoform X1 [Vespula squamosa]|uniref:Zinc finger protein 853-like isoform X1 n=1 Tax=Vespula squamosa TaxID=30214 RepID=A0ABD2AX30_VESSQ